MSLYFQPSTVETESEEYRSHNSTESDLEIKDKGLVVIQDVNTVRSLRHWLKLQSFSNVLFFFFFFSLHRVPRERCLWPS